MSPGRWGGLRPDRIDVELTAYGSDDDAPTERRVDLVHADASTTVASLTPGQALDLDGRLISAVQEARNGRAA